MSSGGRPGSALGLALVAAGAPAGSAASAVLGNRIITAWLPLPPAAVTLGALLRRKVVRVPGR